MFHFDLGCPFSYLAIERVERLLPSARWQPTLTPGGPEGSQGARTRGEAQRRARELRLPLVWPARHPGEVRGAMRAARFATEHGRGAAFALAAAGASRLPVVRVGGALHCGERHLVDAAATLRLAACPRAGAR